VTTVSDGGRAHLEDHEMLLEPNHRFHAPIAQAGGDPGAAERAMHDHLDEADGCWPREDGPLVRRQIGGVH
jgi:hypothetical protein